LERQRKEEARSGVMLGVSKGLAMKRPGSRTKPIVFKSEVTI
jgi:hypothetical protein